jgi:hypothetical protein
MAETTIIYYTDNTLEEGLLKFCQKKLLEAADGKRIISISQKPIDFGENICVGDIGRSHLNLYKQILIGVEKAKTKYIALAEHDCLYVKEHFDYIPPVDDKFFYNVNHWIVRLSDGKYTFARRKVLSMMIASTELTRVAAIDKVKMIEAGGMIRKGQPGACEFGVCTPQEAFVNDISVCEFGVCDHRVEYLRYLASLKDFGKDIGLRRAIAFRTQIPCLDIRHGNNFSGNRHGNQKCYSIPYWGTFKEVLNG